MVCAPSTTLLRICSILKLQYCLLSTLRDNPLASLRTVVRLGEHNIATEEDCSKPDGSVRRCAPNHQDFTPVDIIRHPDFNTRGSVSDDIALIRLNQTVQFSGEVTYLLPLMFIVSCSCNNEKETRAQ